MNITEISFGKGVCPNLKTIHLRCCNDLVEIGALPTTLSSLEIRHCDALNKIRGLSSLTKLLELGMRDCEEVEALPSLEKLISLEWVGISKCDKMTRIQLLLEVVNLESHIFEKLEKKLIEVTEESEDEDSVPFTYLPESEGEEN